MYHFDFCALLDVYNTKVSKSMAVKTHKKHKGEVRNLFPPLSCFSFSKEVGIENKLDHSHTRLKFEDAATKHNRFVLLFHQTHETRSAAFSPGLHQCSIMEAGILKLQINSPPL